MYPASPRVDCRLRSIPHPIILLCSPLSASDISSPRDTMLGRTLRATTERPDQYSTSSVFRGSWPDLVGGGVTAGDLFRLQGGLALVNPQGAATLLGRRDHRHLHISSALGSHLIVAAALWTTFSASSAQARPRTCSMYIRNKSSHKQGCCRARACFPESSELLVR